MKFISKIDFIIEDIINKHYAIKIKWGYISSIIITACISSTYSLYSIIAFITINH